MRKKAVKVKVRKWVTCAEPGCKKRATVKSPFCGPHAKRIPGAGFAKKKADPKKSAAKLERQWLQEKKAARAASPSSRLIKAHCKICDYTIRLSRKWIDVKRPMCPACLRSMVTELDLPEADPRQLPLKKIKKAKKKGGV